MEKQKEEKPDLTHGLGIEVTLKDSNDFLKVRETLTRIGISSKKEERTLYQSCHILHKQGRYWIMMFKELLALDGKETNFSEEDKARRNTITSLLAEWNLLSILDPAKAEEPRTTLANIKIISFQEKKNWRLEVKYNIGRAKDNYRK